MTPEQQTQLEMIKTFPDQVRAATAPLSPAQLSTPFLQNEWSVAQIVHHLADSHMNAFIRMKLILTEENPTLKPYDQEAWAGMADETGPDIQPSLTILTGLHSRWAIVFASLSGADWGRTGHHPEIGPVTVADILASYAQHCQDHLAQMKRVLAAE